MGLGTWPYRGFALWAPSNLGDLAPEPTTQGLDPGCGGGHHLGPGGTLGALGSRGPSGPAWTRALGPWPEVWGVEPHDENRVSKIATKKCLEGLASPGR